ncbi:MAG: PEP-CTERM sorting domain-containing protein [Planctomycetales bacterium]|nr:PEP-CTERM sorting domain-containing protein [Planctomycetales bacterium]
MRCTLIKSVLVAAVMYSLCHAQPAVTDGLTVYYSFDELVDGEFLDGSPNHLNGLITLGFEDANEDDLDDIRLDTDIKYRGAGSAFFDTNADVKEDYIAVCDPVNQPEHNDGCGEPLDDRPAYVPSNGFTVAAWLNVEEVGQDQAVWQSRAGGGGFIHTQVQGNAGARIQLRGDANSDNIVAFNELPNGEPVPFEDWFHFAGTYQKGDDPDVPGEWAFYIDGEEVAGGEANGSVAGFEDLDTLGDWAQGGFIGLVPDFARQLVGHIDEFYLFNRGLSADEILLLRDGVVDPGVAGDFNGNGARDVEDLDMLSAGVRAADANFDLDGDGDADADDRAFWINDLSNTFVGDANFDGQFNSGDFVAVFGAAKYETGADAGWGEGDWNGDGKFDSGDFVAAFQGDSYEKGPREGGLMVVPEPSSLSLLVIAGLGLLGFRRK